MRRILAILLVATTATVVLGATTAAHALDPGAEADFSNRVNVLRASHGLAGVATHPVLTAKAEAWAQHMADTGCLCHSNLPDGVTVGWRKLGENIGRGPNVASIHDALVNSPLHYANMVDPSFHWIGVGVAYGGGMMYVAEVFMDGDAPSAPAPVWSPWFRIGGVLTSGPAAATWTSFGLDVFVRGTDGGIWHNRSIYNVWSGWQGLGAPAVGLTADDPAVASPAPGRIDVFARGRDNHLWHRIYDGTTAHPWENLGGSLSSGPTAASWASNRLDIFSRGPGGDLQHRFWVGTGWSRWESLGGRLTSAPAAVSWAANRIDVFVRGTDNQLWHGWWDGSRWNVWEAQGGKLTTGPAVASWAPGRLDVFAAGTDAQLWHKPFNGAWAGYDPLGGKLTRTPGAVSWTNGHIDVFARGTDSQTWHKNWGS